MGRRGFTLVEVLIAVFMVAIIAGAMMSTALTSRMSVGRVDRDVAAAAAARQVSEALKGFLTADRSLAHGPGVGADGWTLPGDESRLSAFTDGHHDLSPSQWAPALAAYGGRLSYDVSTRQTPSGPQPDVTFTVTWSD